MNKKSFFVCLFLFLTTLIVMQYMHKGSNVVVWKKNLDKIPYTIAGKKGVDIPLGETVIKELDPDVYVFRYYMTKDGSIFNVYIGYYGTGKGGRSAHTPEGCYPGAGWAIIQESKVELALMGKKQETITLNTLLVGKGEKQQIVYHWYQSNRDVVVADGIHQNLNRFKRRLLYNRDDGAFIRVTKDVNNNYPDAKEDVENFIRELFPLLVAYWPEEITTR